MRRRCIDRAGTKSCQYPSDESSDKHYGYDNERRQTNKMSAIMKAIQHPYDYASDKHPNTKNERRHVTQLVDFYPFVEGYMSGNAAFIGHHSFHPNFSIQSYHQFRKDE